MRFRVAFRAFFGEVDPVRRQKCGTTKKRADSKQVETALGAGEKLRHGRDVGLKGREERLM